jgi:predicted Zn-ribbon and HTH transcriptional regulator
MALYQDVEILLTTKHEKEIAIEPAFAELLGARIRSLNLDTDTLGTFAGEVERKGNALECARQKCDWGIQQAGADYGLASEGSFGPHPYIPVVRVDTEILYFIDRPSNIHLHLIEVSTDTNYQMQAVSSIEELQKFAENAGFPEHALILRPNSAKRGTLTFKGIQQLDELIEVFKDCLRQSTDRLVWVETDMRAHLNPSRMRAIARLARKMATRLSNLCPQCQTPGWGMVDVEVGLECAWCASKTENVKFEIFGCPKCAYQEKSKPAHGLEKADPAYCLRCNP